MGQTMPASQQVNRVGKFLYRNIDGAFKFKTSSNTCDVYVQLLYQLPRGQQIPGRQREGYNDMKEMIIDISITTYQNKLRVNVIEVSPMERTLGYDLWLPEDMMNLQSAKEAVWSRVCSRIEKKYKGYEIAY